MNNMFSALVFSDTYEDTFNELVKDRTHASIPFAGRFRTIDFVLSSLVNANISNVAVITKNNYASLDEHLEGGRYWDLNHRNSGLRILSPFFKTENNSEAFMARGRLDALRSVQIHIKSIKEDYVVITNANVVANIDFENVFKSHINSGADITAVYSKQRSLSCADLVVDVDKNSKITEITYSNGDGETKNTSLNIYVMKRDLLLDIISVADAHDYYNFEKYVLVRGVSMYNINGYEHKEYAKVLRTVCDYFEASMKMLNSSVRGEIFMTKRPIVTRPRDSVPTLYQYNAKVENSLVADGCKIDGTVKNSIIFRNVTIETGAVVENSVIMQNCVIKRDSRLNCVVIDNDCTVSEEKNLCGDKYYPYVIEKSTKI